MKRRIELNKKKKGLLYFIKALKKRGFHPEHVRIWESREGMSFKISEAPDFLWGIWERTWRTTDFPKDYPEKYAYFGQFKDFYDKFRPTMVDYSYTKFSEFVDFLERFKTGNYIERIIELLKEGNMDVPVTVENKTDEEIMAEFRKLQEKKIFERSHFMLSPEDYQKALSEKQEFIKYLEGLGDVVLTVLWEANGSDGSGFYTCFHIGTFRVLLRDSTPKEIQEEVYQKMWELKYNCIFRPSLFVGDKSTVEGLGRYTEIIKQ